MKPGQAASYAVTNRVMALAWAVAPLAFSDFFPPQAIPTRRPLRRRRDVPVLLSLPHAVERGDRDRRAATTNALPSLLSHTRPLPWSVANFRTS